MFKPERIAYGDHGFADHGVIGLSHKRRGQLFLDVDFEHGQVNIRVGAHDRCLELAVVGQGDRDFRRFHDHVLVGQHIAVLINDHARAERLACDVARRK